MAVRIAVSFRTAFALATACALVGAAVAGCKPDADWTGYPCDATAPCMSGWQCAGKVCVPASSPATDSGGDAKGGRGLKGPPRIGYLYVGPVGDHGWTKAHDDGRKYLEAAMPGTFTETAPSTPAADAAAKIDEFVANGDNVIIGTSYDFLLAVQNRAANYPDVNFLICSGFITSPNMGSYFGRMYQVKWLAGKVAGHATKTGRIGVVAPVPIAEVVRHINAFTRGVRSVNASAVVDVIWIHNWFDVEKEPKTTRDLVTRGADVIVAMTDTTIPLETSTTLKTQAGDPVWSIGYDNLDSCQFAPDTCLASAGWNWGPLVVAQVRAMVDGTWDPLPYVWEQVKADPQQSPAYLAINEKLVPATVRVQVEELIPQLAKPGIEGQQVPFQAPVRDNAGKERLASGSRFDDQDLLRMCWFVDGVVDADASGKTVPAVVPSACVGDR